MKRAIIIGATSGIGQEVAKILLLEGWKLGVAGRRRSALETFQQIAPDQIEIEELDITQEEATDKLQILINKLGGIDLFLLSSGIGYQNINLDSKIELDTARPMWRDLSGGRQCLYLFQRKRWRSSGCYKFYSRNKRIGSGSRLFCNQTFSEYLYRCTRTTGPPAKTKYLFHRYPSGIRCDSFVERRKTLSNADESGQSRI